MNKSERNMEILRLVDTGMVFGKVGDLYGISRSAVAGIVWRGRKAGIKVKTNPVSHNRPAKPDHFEAVKRTTPRTNKERKQWWAPPPAPDPAPPPEPKAEPEPGGQKSPCAFHELNPGFCQYEITEGKNVPVAEFSFCAKPVKPDLLYCAHHASQVYLNLKPHKERADG